MNSIMAKSTVLCILISSLIIVDSTVFSGKDITQTLFGKSSEGIFPAAFGDFNADKLTDVFSIAADRTTVEIYFAKDEEPLLRLGARHEVKTTDTDGKIIPVNITGLSPGDFDGDGLMDLMVTYQQIGVHDYFEIVLCKGNLTGLDCMVPTNFKNETIELIQEPLLVDINGDMVMDFVGEYWKKINNQSIATKAVWVFYAQDPMTYQRYDFSVDFTKFSNNFPKNYNFSDPKLKVVTPSSNAIVDMDGDTVPELVMVTSTGTVHDSKPDHFIEYYRIEDQKNENEWNFVLTKVIAIGGQTEDQVHIVGQPLFLDLSQSGELVHLLPYCATKNCQKSGFKVIFASGQVSNLEIQGNDDNDDLNKWNFIVGLNSTTRDDFYHRSISLRVGDYNMDGYPDLIGALRSAKGEWTKKEYRAVIFENVPCINATSKKDPCDVPRSFRLNLQSLASYEDVSMATFFDIYEDGLLDVLIVRRTSPPKKGKSEEKYSAFGMLGSPDYDANFLKVVVTTGKPCRKCPSDGPPYGELTGDPKSDSDKEFAPTRTYISVSKELPRINSGYSDDVVFTNLQKGSLYELMLDRILTPRGFGGIEFNNYFVRLQWSLYPFDSAKPYYKPKCLLAGLTSNFQLKIYDTKSRRQYIDKREPEELIPEPLQKSGKETEDDSETVKYHDGWLPLLDLTKTYNDILYPIWIKNETSKEFSFNSYKERMYELAILAFSWIDSWDEPEDSNVSHMMTFQCNGDVVIWKIIMGHSPTEGDAPLHTNIMFKENLTGNNIVSTHKFFKITNNLAILAVGFKKGGISVFRVERRLILPLSQSRRADESEHQSSNYWIGNVESLCESDELQIEFLDLILVPKEEVPDKSVRLYLLAVKHPHTIICFRLQIRNEKIVWTEMNRCQSPVGHIVDVTSYSSNGYMVNHENGTLSFVEIGEDGLVYFLTDTGDPIITEKEEEEDPSKENRSQKDETQDSHLWLHHGFALSPNKTLGCFSKSLALTNDTIVVKEPSECTFVSLFPSKDAWPAVKEYYELHNYSLQKINDVLQGFRYQLRISKDFDSERYLDGKTMAEMTLSEVKLYLWTLKAMGLPKPWKFVKQEYIPKDELARMKLNIVKNIALGEEQVMEKYMTNLLEIKMEEHFASPIDSKCASIIQQYLLSKPSPQVTETSHIYQIESQCPECGQEFSFANNKDYDPSTGVTRPGIPGYRWKGQTCSDQHSVSVCVLSLVPFDYPNRVCPFCGCAALMEPAFGQKPICPFCEEFMVYEPMIEEDSNEESDEFAY